MQSLISYRELIRNLVLKDLKLKYRDSTIGFLWSLANPLLLIVVYSFVFSRMLRVNIAHFPLFLLVGILPWNFFATSLLMSTGSVVENGQLIRKVWLPIEVFPIATVLFNLAQFLLALAVLLPTSLLFFQSSLTVSWIAFLPVLFLQVLFTLGVCFFLSTATVFYRDVKHFSEVFLMLLFWLTPVVYDIRTLPESLRAVVFLNPVSLYIASYQDIFYRQTFPDASSLVIQCFLSLASLSLGYLFFRRYKFRFAEEV